MQKIIPKKVHKSLPAFSLQSTRSFKVFRKNCPKNVYKLNIDCIIGQHLELDQTKRILMDLIKLTKKCSKFKVIQDISLSKFLNARTSQALYVIKKFYRVQSIGLIWNFCDVKIQIETRYWLKYTNMLQSLYFRQIEKGFNAYTVLQAGNLNVKLARDVKRRKIKKIIHSVLPSKFHIKDHHILNMNNYPSTIQELSLDLSRCSLLIDYSKPMSQLVSMQKFPFLTKLELLFPLETETAWMLLKTIPNPHLLTSLGLYLWNHCPKHDEQDIIPIFDFIADCPELEKLSLRVAHLTNKLEILSRLSSQYKLRILNLWVNVRTDKHLEDLGAMISNPANLENLDITIDFSSDSLSPKTFSKFYQGICELTQLKRLYVNFTSKETVKRIKPISSELVGSLCNLSHLEELYLYLFDVNLHLEFPGVLEGLAKLGAQLKKFSMNFSGNSFSEKDELGLIDVLKKMKGLRELEIFQFSFKQSLLKFKAVLEGYKDLKKIIWEDFELPKEGSEIFFGMIISILEKKGVEEVILVHNWQADLEKSSKEILFVEILEKNPELRAVKIVSQVVSNDFYNSPFAVYKYV